ncbi:MAG TPA: hypothetical protein VF244_01425 [Acidimicrobiales bacterium]
MASNPAQGPGGLQGLAARWNDLAKPWRINIVLYALTALSLVALVFELVAGDDPAPRVDLASQAPTTVFTLPSTVPASTRPTTSTSSTSSTVPPTTQATSRPVVTDPPDDEPVDETTSTTEDPNLSTTTTEDPNLTTTTTEEPTTTTTLTDPTTTVAEQVTTTSSTTV